MIVLKKNKYIVAMIWINARQRRKPLRHLKGNAKLDIPNYTNVLYFDNWNVFNSTKRFGRSKNIRLFRPI